jgi:hypothetical protein
MTKKTTVITLIICIILAGGYASQVYAMDTKIGTPITMPQFPVLTERYAGTGLPNLQVFFPALFNLETPVFLPWVDTDSKSAVRNYYLNNYLASNGVDPGWTGNHKLL